MDTQVLTPAPGQTIVATETHRNHGHHGNDLSGQIARDFIATTQQIRAEFNATDAQLGTGFAAGALASCKTDDAIANGTLLAAQAEGRSLLEAAKNAAALAVQADRNSAALGVQADKNWYALTVEAVKNASAAQLEAQKNAAAVAAQIAECCCETKALITADGNATRALINAGVVDGLRAQLSAAQSTSAALFARNIAPVVPIT